MDEQEQGKEEAAKPNNPQNFTTINDLFDSFFQGQQRPGAKKAGLDLRHELTIEFDEAAFGCQKEITLQRRELCPGCGGSGAQPSTKSPLCPDCKGVGEIRRVQKAIFGDFVNVVRCDRCQGRGKLIVTPCQQCRGEGRVYKSRQVVVNIPAGVDNGINVRIIGEGEAGVADAAAGNLYVVLTVKPHPVFKRQGSDLLYELPISIRQAALGDTVEVPMIHNAPRTLKIPPGTQSGQTFVLKGQGVPVVHSTARGDLRVTIKVVIPTELTPEEQALFTQLPASKIEQSSEQEKEPSAEQEEKQKSEPQAQKGFSGLRNLFKREKK
jgi:molecular chaperone DnaJ